MNALEELKKWCRKYYKFRVESNGSVQPGDGISVHLEGGGRTIAVYEEDMPEASLDQMILEAIRLWHADSSVKKYRCFWTHQEETCPDYRWAKEVNGVRWSSGVYMAVIQAINEYEVKACILSGYPEGFDTSSVKITVYEWQNKK